MNKVDLLGKTEMAWYNLYKDFIDSVPMGSIDEKTGEMHVINYNNCNELYKYVRGDFGAFKIFSEPSISVCEHIAYCSERENRFEFEDRVNNMEYDKRLDLIRKRNQQRGDYINLRKTYGKFLKAFREGILGKQIEESTWDYDYEREVWKRTTVENLIECGPRRDYRVKGEYCGK